MKRIFKKSIMENLRTLEEYQLTLVQAPPGFGKTTALKQHFNKRKDDCIWFDLKRKELNQCNIDLQKHNYNFVFFDHFKRGHFDEGIIEDLVLKKHDLHVVIISSDEIPSFFIKNFHKTKIHKLDMINFHFNLKDIHQLVKINEIQISDDDLYKIYDYSGGWIKGIKILLETYAIFNSVKVTNHYMHMIEQDLFLLLDKHIRITLCYLYDLKEIPVEILLYFDKGNEILQLLKSISSIGWLVSYNEQRNVYSLTTPFKAFLAEKVITYKIDLMDMYLQFAVLYEKKMNHLEAMRFYEKVGNHSKVIALIESYPNANYTDYDAELMKNVYDSIPYELLIVHPYVYLHMIHDHLSTFHDLIHGKELLDDFNRLLQEGVYGDKTDKLKGELHLIRGFSSYNDLRQMCYHFNKAYGYLTPELSRIANNKMIITYGSPHILYLYHREAGKASEIADLFYQNISKYYEITDFSGVGIAQLTDAEYLLEKGKYREAETMALEAYYKAKDFSQICIAAAALLTIGRVSFMTYKKDMYQYAIDSLKAERDRATVELLKGQIDCALGYLFALHGDLNQIADWLVDGRRKLLLNEANSYVYIIYGLILLKKKQYFQLKVIADILSKIHVHQKHIFGDIYALIYKTIALYNLGEKDNAKICFNELIHLAAQDMIVMPIIELSEFLDSFLPKKANTKYMKLLVNKIKEKQFNWRTSVFSQREQEIIQYINAGYTRKKTAELLSLKESTVATYMKRIYKKANINDKDELKDFCNRL